MTKIIFIGADGRTRYEVEAEPGQTLLEVAHENEIDIEGACEGSMACSTCHVIVAEADYDRLPPPSADEEDLLDLAYGLSATSRLGCQIVVTEKLDGLTVKLPVTTHNILLD
jgi:2Fe-2S ferredoxin